MEIKVEEISRIIRQQIEDYDKQVEVSETGTVLSAGDGVARVYGLENAMAGGDNCARGLALGLLLGAANGISSVPKRWVEDLKSAKHLDQFLETNYSEC